MTRVRHNEEERCHDMAHPQARVVFVGLPRERMAETDAATATGGDQLAVGQMSDEWHRTQGHREIPR